MKSLAPAWRGTSIAAGLLILLALAALAARRLLPIDETRYAAVAWEMWLRGDALVPHLNGEPYSEKGPVLFWLINAGWFVVGVSDWWVQMVPPLCSLGSLVATAILAARLWPERPQLAGRAPLLLFGSIVFCSLSTILVTDAPLLLLVLVALVCLAGAWRGGGWLPWVGFGAATGLGILTKGPVALLHGVPLALAAPWWATESRPRSWGRWYAGVLAATVLALAIALGWALSAARAGGPEYADAILWRQTAGRVVRSFAHARPWWWYLAISPLLLLPYSAWPRFWRAVASLRREGADAGTRFCLALIAIPVLVFSVISGKQVHYLLPQLVGFVLLAARALDVGAEPERPWDRVVVALPLLIGGIALLIVPLVPRVAAALQRETPVLSLLRGASWWLGLPLIALASWMWRRRDTGIDAAVREIAVSIGLVALVAHVAVIRALGPAYDLSNVGAYLQQAERENRDIANVGRYDGQFQFSGRLLRTPDRIEPGQVEEWFETHPDGVVVDYSHRQPAEAGATRPPLVRPYRGQTLILWTRDSFRAAVAPTGPED